MKKKKCWVSYCAEYPRGVVFERKVDALEYSKNCRESGEVAYVRVGYFTQERLDDMQEV